MMAMPVILSVLALSASAGVLSMQGVDRRIGDSTTYYVDPELWGPDRLITWQDYATNDVYIAQLNPTTGDMIPANGRGIKVPIKAAPIFNGPTGYGSFNGPEFGRNANGLFVYFVCRDSRSVNQTGRFGPLVGGTPAFTQLTSASLISRSGVIPTTDPTLPVGAVLCTYLNNTNGTITWRFDNEPFADRPVPLADFGLKGVRWLPGQLKVSTNVLDSRGIRQAAIYDVLTSTTTIITNDNDPKSDVFIFDCPEFGSLGMMCVVGTTQRQLAVYRQRSGFWERVTTYEAPRFLLGGGATAQIFLPEPFVYQGQTHFVFAFGVVDVATLSPLGPAQVFVAKLGLSAPVRVGSRFPAARIDPEVVIMNDKAFLYYYTVSPPTGYPNVKPELHVITDFLPLPSEAQLLTIMQEEEEEFAKESQSNTSAAPSTPVVAPILRKNR
jgi:hypothetical protein